jgi:hypothetical protein
VIRTAISLVLLNVELSGGVTTAATL